MQEDRLRALPFSPEERCLPALLRRQAERFGDKPLVAAGAWQASFGEAPVIAARAAGRLLAAGIKPGDRVALISSNRPEFIETMLGCGWLGAILVPINVASRGAQLQHILGNSAARLLVIEAEFLSSLDHLDLAALPLEAIWLIDAPGEGVTPPAIARSMPPLGAAVDTASPRPEDLFAVLYTSGTTGPSKGVCCPHAQYFWWGVHTAHLLGIDADDVLCTTLPLFHTNALNTFFQALITGATAIFEPRFSASRFWDGLTRRGATVAYLLGAMVPILLSRPPDPKERAHRVPIALAPGVPGHFHEEFTRRTGIHLLDGYGSTETNFVIGTGIEGQRPGLMGRVCPGFAARIVDDRDRDVADGGQGELILSADEPLAFARGYFAAPEKTAEAWRDGWFHTGDRVIRDRDGYFKFVDRLKDAIRRRGENISSFEVEQVLLSHPEVATAAVFPVRSDLAEDEVMAAIVLHSGGVLDAADLVRFCAPRMPYFAVPRYIEFCDTLPATESGKIQKFKLRERGVTAATWDREAAGIKIPRR
ncbi:MAG: ATP-dependent acyl-CoA ligase [Stellaceae bacterium]